jgi:lipopolysaccharide transport system ATP-binding protein
MQGPAVRVSNLTKQYQIGASRRNMTARGRVTDVLTSLWRRQSPDVITVLNDLSFDIRHGEIVGIVGTNGAGKSTLLKILSRVTFPTSGEVHVAGRVASLLEVGTGFHDELTGRENVYLNGSIFGMKKKQIAARFDEIVDYSGVERFIDTPIKRYSSGMRMRLGFAVAAHLDPDVLIVDEVLAVGDAAFQRKCLKTMEGLRHGGRTVLFVSHNLGAVENLCSRAIWLQGGRIKLDGPSREVTQKYMSANADVMSGSVTLDAGTERSGNGDVRLTRIELLDERRQLQDIVRPGDHLVIRFYYRASKSLANLGFGYTIVSEFGMPVTESSTQLHNIVIPKIPIGDAYIDVDIPALNLMPGTYYLTAGVASLGGDVHDTAQNCLRIDVQPSAVYSSGRVVDYGYGAVFFPQTWNLDGMRHDEER